MKTSFQTVFVKLSFVLVVFCSTLNFVSAQVDTSLTRQILTGALENHLKSNLGGRLGTINVSERFTAGNSTVLIAARNVSTRLGTFDQITIKITEAGKTQLFSLVQAADGKLSELQGNQLVALRSNNPLGCVTQLFGAASSCNECKTKILNCISQNNTFLKRVRCVTSTFDGSCISCGIGIATIIGCLRSN
jgi:hypothetical protein